MEMPFFLEEVRQAVVGSKEEQTTDKRKND
jgi:hypothetical protein